MFIKLNMMVHLQIVKLDYYIKHGEGNKHVRMLFYNQKYDDFEE